MINLVKTALVLTVSLLAGCESASRWKDVGTRTVVSFIPRTVDKHLGEIAEKSQSPGVSSTDVPAEAGTLINVMAGPLLADLDVAPLVPRLQVVRSGVPNAYAFPHGAIFVTSKLISISKHPEEILAVLAHEIAHVVQRHSMQQLVTTAGVSLAINLVFGDLGTIADIFNTGGQLLTLKFSRDHERDADALGAEILRKAQLPLSGMASFFERMQEFEKSQAGLPVDSSMLALLRTHPQTEERIATARGLVSEASHQVRPEQRKAYDNLKKMFQ